MPDTTPPVIGASSISTPTVYSSTNCGPTSVVIQVSVTDNSSGVAGVTLLLRDTSTGGLTSYTMQHSSGNTWTKTIAFTDIGYAGTFNPEFRAVDNAKNLSGIDQPRGLFSTKYCIIIR